MASDVAWSSSDDDEAYPAWLEQRYNVSPAAIRVLKAAGQLATGTEPGARHIAKVLFSQHPVGTRVAVATCCTDVWILRGELDRNACLTRAEASAKGLSDDPMRFLEYAHGCRSSDGPLDIRELFLALFEPALELGPVFFNSGLVLKDVQKHLPKALKAVRLYETQARNITQQPSLPPELPPKPKAIGANSAGWYDRETAAQTPSLSDLESHGGYRAGTGSVGGDAGATQEKIAEMAEMAPRSLKGAAERGSTMLEQCGTDLVVKAKNGGLDPVIGRDEEIARALRILSRRTKNNVCLVGEPGVGKTAIAEAIAQRIASGLVPFQLRECRELWSLDIAALIAGTGLRGDFEERLLGVLDEIRAAQGAKMLFIDELHLVLGAGRSEGNNVDAANLMKPMLARGEIRCIGATTSDEYNRLILARDAAFERRFQVVEIAEPSLEKASLMLRGLLPLYASHHGVQLTSAIADAAVSLSHAQIHGRTLPDKAIDVLDEACCCAADAGAV